MNLPLGEFEDWMLKGQQVIKDAFLMHVDLISQKGS